MRRPIRARREAGLSRQETWPRAGGNSPALRAGDAIGVAAIVAK